MAGRAATSAWVRVLIDEMYTAEIASQLRARAHDAVAVHERSELGGTSDVALLRWAHAEGRAIVTENARDFLLLHAAFLRSGEAHSGIVLTSNARYPRGRESTTGALIGALDMLLAQSSPVATDVVWL